MSWRHRWGVAVRLPVFYRHLQYVEFSDNLHTLLTVLPWPHPATPRCTQLDWLRYRRSQELLWLHSVISCFFCVWRYRNTTSHTMSMFTGLSPTTTVETGSSSKTLLPNHQLHGVTHHRTYILLSMEPQTWNTVPSPTYINKLPQNTHQFLPHKTLC